MSTPSKSCTLDVLPMWLLKENIADLAKPLTTIINMSFSSGVFPTKLREAFVTPILKKPTLDRQCYKNYRPVSNISYVSKIMEKIICTQMNEHLTTNNLQERFQSAYRQQHSTETALLCVKTDLLRAMDENHAIAVVLLDLSAAFDTVDHLILLNRLSSKFGIRGKALTWIRSYLHNRSFRVRVGDSESIPHDLKCGVPQGSVVGPLFFTLYTADIGAIIRRHNINYHIYADVQLYNSFDPKIPGDAVRAVFRLTSCINEISDWMTRNKLKLNHDKTEFFVGSSDYNNRRYPYINDIHIAIGDSLIKPSAKIKNLGVFFDKTLSMRDHVKSTITTEFSSPEHL